MDIERLRKIIAYNDEHQEGMAAHVKSFYSYAGMSLDQDVLNLMQIARPAFQKKGYLVLELVLADEEIGALCYKGDSLGYIVLNTSLPKVNVNFAICHELYHVFFQQHNLGSKVEFANEDYGGHEEELAANLFAGMLLMPENGFRRMYFKFREESGHHPLDTIVRLMNYYQAPYMSVLIRCYALKLPEKEDFLPQLLNIKPDDVRARFVDLWLDESILDAAKKDDYGHLEELVRSCGRECIEDACLNERTLKKVLQNMAALYDEIKGG